MKRGRRTFLHLTLILLLAGGLAGCLQHDSATFAPSFPSESRRGMPEDWQILLTVSGGFSGLRRTMELSGIGSMTVTDQRSGRRVTGLIPEDELARIALLVDDVRSLKPSGRLLTCRDCLEYELILHIDGQLFSTQLNDLSLSMSGIEPLISILLKLQERALSGNLQN